MKKSETKQHIVAPVEGMTCAACVARVEKSLSLTKGLSNVSVNFATEKASFNIDTSITNYEDVVKVIEASGYKINLSHEFQQEDEISVADSNNFKSKDERELKNNFFLAAILSLPILLLNMGSMWNEFYKLISLNSDEVNKVLLLLTTPVVFIAGKRFYKIAWQKLKHFSADMNTLVAIGTGSAYLFSSVITLFPIIYSEDSTAQHVYFDTAAVIITLILLGRWLESRAKSRTGSAIKKLLELKPKTAIIIRNGSEVEISLYNLRLGDIVIVKPGAQIPADGIVTSGYSSVDESMITGESVPVGKEIGSKIIGGTINFNGSFQFNVTALGNSSLLGQIIKMIEKAQGSKAPIQKLADKIASIFVPVILLIAVITFSGWMLFGTEGGINTALLNFVAVLIIACPCALGLATPTAIIVGTGKGAQNGILIKNSETLELGHKISTVIFDKTGTITEGKPKVESITTIGMAEKDFVKMIASVENRSEHPLANAIIEFAKGKTIDFDEVEDFESHPGFGLSGKVNGNRIFIGNEQFMKLYSISFNSLAEINSKLFADGKTVVFGAINSELKGLIAIEDPIKSGAIDSIQKLKLMNLKTVMLTGDNKFAAETAAKKTGVNLYEAEVLPDQKIDSVRKHQQKGEIVAMVGDGINDSPALAQSDIGIAIGTGTDIAIETGDIVLMSGELNGVVNAIRLSKRTIKTIKQNLFWAFFYNIIGIPLAAFGILTPIFAALAMSFSSISVVSNSLRLKQIKF